jgi:hypothetical protein
MPPPPDFAKMPFLPVVTISVTHEARKPQRRHRHGMVATIGAHKPPVLLYGRRYPGFADHVK